MALADITQMDGLLVCPACHAPLARDEGAGVQCRAMGCTLANTPFLVVAGQLVLVDFATSVLSRAYVEASGGASVVRRRGQWSVFFQRLTDGVNKASRVLAGRMLRELAGAQTTRRPRLLIVGGGTRGPGTDALYSSPDIDVVAFDIYASPNTSLIADGHAMPFADGSFDGVWVQSVLEHVVDPPKVVAQINRVLAPGGLVFAETPFLWPVHERAYDFTRWTASGLRWLFRDFAIEASGTSSGPGTACLMGIRYFLGAITGRPKIGRLLIVPLVWLIWLDRFCDARVSLDAAGGVFLLGRKAQLPASVPDLIAYYDEQLVLEKAARVEIGQG
jgi:SAM-dependent methyltransferase